VSTLAARTAVSNCSPIESSSSTVGDAFQRAQTQLVLDRIPVLDERDRCALLLWSSMRLLDHLDPDPRPV
jgi:hypothetical protein